MLAAILALSLAGTTVATGLTVLHFEILHGAGAEHGLCLFAAAFDCDRVNASAFSEIAGLPVAVLGQAAFATAFALALGAWLAGAERARRCAFALVVLAAGSTTFAAGLLAISALHIGALCSLCLLLDAITVATLVLALRLPREGTLRAPEPWLAAALFAGTAALSGQQYAAASERALAAELGGFERQYAKLPVEDLPPAGDRPALGPEGAPVTILVFSDFRCSHCKRLAQTLRTLDGAFSGRLRIVFRHFPVCSDCNPYVPGTTHPDACLAARAAEAAREQGRFWEMHDALFAREGRLDEGAVLAIAAAAGLDAARLRGRLAAPELDRRIAEDARLAEDLQIRGTPLVFVNGKRFTTYRLEVLRKAVRMELFREGGRGIDAPEAAEAKKSSPQQQPAPVDRERLWAELATATATADRARLAARLSRDPPAADEDRLRALAADPAPAVAFSGARGLLRLGRGLEALSGRVAAGSPRSQRLQAITLLATAMDVPGVRALVEAQRDDADATIRERARAALGRR